ncbi:hypothetical protein [Deinococcus aquatilis]|nr:hypothetical protein [Deinococcus aquatilis]
MAAPRAASWASFSTPAQCLQGRPFDGGRDFLEPPPQGLTDRRPLGDNAT